MCNSCIFNLFFYKWSTNTVLVLYNLIIITSLAQIVSIRNIKATVGLTECFQCFFFVTLQTERGIARTILELSEEDWIPYYESTQGLKYLSP